VLEAGREGGDIHGLHNPNLPVQLMSVICLGVDGAVAATSVGSPESVCTEWLLYPRSRFGDAENLRVRRGFTVARDETPHVSAGFKDEFRTSVYTRH
jgi:hypothetical protein